MIIPSSVLKPTTPIDRGCVNDCQSLSILGHNNVQKITFFASHQSATQVAALSQNIIIMVNNLYLGKIYNHVMVILTRMFGQHDIT